MDTEMEEGEMMLKRHTASVDFVLAYDGDASSQTAAKERNQLLLYLESMGLEFAIDDNQRLHFVTIHVPHDVLRRYCHILKMHMPMVELPRQNELIPLDFTGHSTYRILHEYSLAKEYLFDAWDPQFFTPSIRIAVVDHILQRADIGEKVGANKPTGIERLIQDRVFLAAYPLHGTIADEELGRQLPFEWRPIIPWYKEQTLDDIKEHCGVKVAMYFAWSGFNTYMQTFATLITLIYLCVWRMYENNGRVSQEICSDNRTIMCPRCDGHCDYWYLNTTCDDVKKAHMYDNGLMILYTITMSIWATVNLQVWKRYLYYIQHRWGIAEYCSLAEPPRAQYLARLKDISKTMFNIVTGSQESSPPFWTRKVPCLICSYLGIFLFVLLKCAIVFVIDVFGMSLILYILGDGGSVSKNVINFPATTGFINLVVSIALSYAYQYVAVYMTNMEYCRTQTDYNESLNLKIYLFEFVNYYSSIVYIAFIKGKFIGYPAKYNRILHLRQEECSPGGCLRELHIQLGIIMFGKQIILAIIDFLRPGLTQMYKEYKGRQSFEAEAGDNCAAGYKHWTKDFYLLNWNERILFNEYLKIAIQYGFIMIFVVAFPLAPVLAWLGSIVMVVNIDTYLRMYKRPVPQRARDISIWYNITLFITIVAILAHAFIIAFSSNFIPRLVYMYVVNPTGTDEGFVNHTLAYFNITHFEEHVAPLKSQFSNVSICRYLDYRNPPDDAHPYERPLIYWQILAIRLTFVLIYLILVSFVQIVVAWAIPDVPGRLQDQIKREQYLINQYIIEQQELKMQRTSTVIVPNAHGSECVAGNGHIPSEDGSLPEEKMMHNTTAVKGGCVLRKETSV